MKEGDSVRILNPRQAGLALNEWLGRIVGVTDGKLFKVHTNLMGEAEYKTFTANQIKPINLGYVELMSTVDEARERLMDGRADNVEDVIGQLYRDGYLYNDEQSRAVIRLVNQER